MQLASKTNRRILPALPSCDAPPPLCFSAEAFKFCEFAKWHRLASSELRWSRWAGDVEEASRTTSADCARWLWPPAAVSAVFFFLTGRPWATNEDGRGSDRSESLLDFLPHWLGMFKSCSRALNCSATGNRLSTEDSPPVEVVSATAVWVPARIGLTEMWAAV